VHTHPKDTPDPSPQDREEARRLNLPVLVVTPRGVVAAMPSGGDLQIR
jgi:proteasome lid subunit RPN8/RPN11